MDTPYQWTKQVASHWGGTRNGTIVQLAERHRGPGRDPQPVRALHRRRAHRARGGRDPRAGDRPRRDAAAVRGHRDELLASTTRRPPSSTPRSTSRCSGNRAIFHKGWTAVAKHKDPWLGRTTASTTTSGSSTTSRRTGPSPTTWPREEPERLAHLQRLFLIQAARFNVLPLDIRSAERMNPDIAGRPALITADTQTFYPGMRRMSENSTINIKNKSCTVAADVTVPGRAAPTAWSSPRAAPTAGGAVYAHDGKLRFAYNLLGIKLDIVASDSPVPAGRARAACSLRLRRRRRRQGRHGHAVRR